MRTFLLHASTLLVVFLSLLLISCAPKHLSEKQKTGAEPAQGQVVAPPPANQHPTQPSDPRPLHCVMTTSKASGSYTLFPSHEFCVEPEMERLDANDLVLIKLDNGDEWRTDISLQLKGEGSRELVYSLEFYIVELSGNRVFRFGSKGAVVNVAVPISIQTNLDDLMFQLDCQLVTSCG